MSLPPGFVHQHKGGKSLKRHSAPSGATIDDCAAAPNGKTQLRIGTFNATLTERQRNDEVSPLDNPSSALSFAPMGTGDLPTRRHAQESRPARNARTLPCPRSPRFPSTNLP